MKLETKKASASEGENLSGVSNESLQTFLEIDVYVPSAVPRLRSSSILNISNLVAEILAT